MGLGLGKLFLYSNTPGPSQKVSVEWPPTSGLKRAPTQPTLLLFLHPDCPCSKASLGELERLMPFLQNHAETFVVFSTSKGQSKNWEKEKLWKKAQSIPNVQVIADGGGEEAKHFGAETSGHAMLYDENGLLVFSGGITPERGHMGDSRGRTAVLSILEKRPAAVPLTPVFGCFLANPERALKGESK